MLPIKLLLKNYRTITDADLNMSQITAASITGVNGAGKSSICESIAYALYGESRSLSVDGVVQNGAEEASVQFDYAHDANIYRVIRKRSRGKKTELQYLMQSGDGWLTITGASIADTQNKINADLAMDKNLFLATSFVTQDKSAGFCDAGAAERKQVLSSIFEDRLGKFPVLHDNAKARVKSYDTEQMVLNSEADRFRATINGLGNTADLIKGLQAELFSRTDALTKEESLLDNYKSDQAKAQAESDKHSGLQKQLAEFKEEIEELTHLISKNDAIVEEAETLIASADQIRADCDKADELEKQLETLNNLQTKYQGLTSQYIEKESEYDKKHSEMTLDQSNSISDYNLKIHKLKNGLSALTDNKARYERELQSAKDVSGLLEEVPCKNTPLSNECKLLSNARNAVETINLIEKNIADNDADLVATQQLLKDQELELQGYNKGKEESLAKLEKEKTDTLNDLKKQGQALGYNKDNHTAVIAQYNEAKQSRSKLSEVSAAESRVHSANDAIKEAERKINGKKFQIIGVEKDIEAIKGKSAGIDLVDVIRRKSDTVEYLKSEINTLNKQIAVKEADLENLSKADADLFLAEKKLEELSKERTLYFTLRQAFSRDGIPALIIDAAIPDSQDRANDVLSRLSDGKMSLKLVTQKNTSSAGIKETLDIVISDTAWGERSYEEWSGGEKLRINLAIRIALGEILAARTGAKIELLVLDEVCSPLDEDGEAALIDCVNRLQTSFGCVLLITHKPTIKDRLPQSIELKKSAKGSIVEVAA